MNEANDRERSVLVYGYLMLERKVFYGSSRMKRPAGLNDHETEFAPPMR